MSNNKFKERLKNAMEYRNISQAELSRRSKIPEASISNYLSGGYKAGNKNLALLAQSLFVSIEYLLGLSNDLEENNDNKKINYKDVDYDVIDTTVDIPIVGGVKAGVLIGAEDNHYETYGVDESIVTDAQENFIIKIEGDSMSPLFLDKDYILCKTQSDVYSNGNLGIVALEDTKPVIKRIYKYADKIILRSENPLYKDIVITGSELENFRIVGIPKYLVKREF